MVNKPVKQQYSYHADVSSSKHCCAKVQPN